MAHKTREEAIRLGIKVAPTKHRQTRRASWKNYWMEGVYGITIHICEDKEGKVEKCMLLSEIVGSSDIKPQIGEYETHAQAMRPEHETFQPRPEHEEAPQQPTPIGTQSQPAFLDGTGACSQTSLSEEESAPHPRLTALGRIIDRKIREIGTHLHEEQVMVTHHVIMPSHIHMIVKVAGTLPWHTWNGSQKRWTLSDIIKGFEKGCTSWFYRMLEGETIDEIFATPTKRRSRKEPPMVWKDGEMVPVPSIWHKDGFSDKILMTDERHANWLRYLCYNAYYWKLVDDYPKLFEHVLHLTLGDADYTAYGCMFLLGRTDRKQVMCHRLARRGMLTEREWQLATQSMEVVRAYEKNAKDLGLGRFDWDWYRSSNPETITAIDYTRTEAFRKQKAELLQACEEEDAVLVSPAVSRGEQQIVQAALDLGFPVIKLVKKPIAEKGHAIDKDRDYCAKAQMLVLGPWEIKQREITNGSVQSRSVTDKDFWNGQYAKFHNLNDMAADLCVGVKEFELDKKELEECR